MVMPELYPSGTIQMVEGGFQLRPELLEEYIRMHDAFEPYAIRSPGFKETYGGIVNNTNWGMFSSKFSSLTEMHRWHKDERHQKIIGLARSKYWTAYYIRKWQSYCANAIGQEVLHELRLHRRSTLNSREYRIISEALSFLQNSNAICWERLSGMYADDRFLFAGPLTSKPVYAEAMFLIMTRWRSKEDLEEWTSHPLYKALSTLGDVDRYLWIPVIETEDRVGMRPDGRQVDWCHPDFSTR
jgi:heme-degrading monooxygenase HmoA